MACQMAWLKMHISLSLPISGLIQFRRWVTTSWFDLNMCLNRWSYDEAWPGDVEAGAHAPPMVVCIQERSAARASSAQVLGSCQVKAQQLKQDNNRLVMECIKVSDSLHDSERGCRNQNCLSGGVCYSGVGIPMKTRC